MDPRKTHRKAGLAVLAVVLVAAIALYVVESANSWPPSEAAVKQLLRRLPYRFEFRPVAPPKGANGAIAGKVIGPHKTIVNFGIALGGEGRGVPVPHAGTLNASGGTAFVVTDDEQIRGKLGNFEPGKQFHTVAQEHVATRMMVDIEETLCKARTGKPCEI
jgi:hypothetical protein